MRDVIWTIIIIWLVYRLIDIFKTATRKKEAYINNEPASDNTPHSKPGAHHDSDIKKAVRNHLNKEGEYVDFEEVK